MYTWTEATTGGDPIILSYIYNWSRSSYNYGFSDYLDPGYTYWIYAYYDCSLLFPSGYLHLNAAQQNFEEKKNNELDTNSLQKADSIIEYFGDKLAITWDVQIDFDETGGTNDWVIFGEAPDAFDEFEQNDTYDIPNPPPGIPPFLDSFITTGW